MKSFILSLLLIFSSSPAWADGGIFVGLNNTSMDSTVDGITYGSAIGVDAGWHKVFDFGYTLFLRSGLGVRLNRATAEIGSTEVDLSFINVEVPLTVLYDFGDVVAGYTGVNALFNASSSCDVEGGSCTITDDAESMVFNFVIGGNFALSYYHVIELYIEFGMSEIYTDTQYGSTGFRYIYMFE